MPDIITATEYVNIDTVPLATPAWRIVNVTELIQSADRSGTDLVIPGAHGARPYRRWRRPTKRMLELWIFGAYTRTGGTNTDARKGLYANIKILEDGLTADPGGDGTRTVTVHLPDGHTYTGPAHVGPLTWAPFTPTIVKATLEVSIPAGELVYA